MWLRIATSRICTSEHRARQRRFNCWWGRTWEASWTFLTVEIKETAKKRTILFSRTQNNVKKCKMRSSTMSCIGVLSKHNVNTSHKCSHKIVTLYGRAYCHHWPKATIVNFFHTYSCTCSLRGQSGLTQPGIGHPGSTKIGRIKRWEMRVVAQICSIYYTSIVVHPCAKEG